MTSTDKQGRHTQARRAARVLLVCLAAGFGLFAVLSDGQVERRYPTLQAAREDGLFEKGWLPDVLPPSATGIRVSNKLNANGSAGEFRFDPEEYPILLDKTVPYLPRNTTVAEYDWFDKTQGARDLRFAEYGGRKWLFICIQAQGVCTFDMVPASGDLAAQ